MRAVIIGGTGWTESHPQRIRSDLVRMVFSLAAQHGYDVLVAGQRWRDGSNPSKPSSHAHTEPLSDKRWAILMGRTPLSLPDPQT